MRKSAVHSVAVVALWTAWLLCLSPATAKPKSSRFSAKHFCYDSEPCPTFMTKDGKYFARCEVEEPDEGPMFGSVAIYNVQTGKIVKSFDIGELPVEEGDGDVKEALKKLNRYMARKKFTVIGKATAPLKPRFAGTSVDVTWKGRDFYGRAFVLSSPRCCVYDALVSPVVFERQGILVALLTSSCSYAEEGPCGCPEEERLHGPCHNPVRATVILRGQVTAQQKEIPQVAPKGNSLGVMAKATHPYWADPETGLTWQNPPGVDPIGWFGADEPDPCNSLDLGAHRDWRVPTIGELRTLIRGCPTTELGGRCQVREVVCSHSSCVDPCLTDSCSGSCNGCKDKCGPADGCYWPNGTLGPCRFYWSSSRYPEDSESVWGVSFADGSISYIGVMDRARLRCVRTSQLK